MAFPANFDNIPALPFESNLDPFDYELIQQMITQGKSDTCDCITAGTAAVTNKLDVLDSGLKQVISEVTDEVNENQTLLEVGSNTIKVMV